MESACGELCGLLLALGVMAPWLKANGKGKELTSLWKSLVLPACDPKGFDSAAAAAGKGAAGPQLTLSMQLPATPSNSSSAAAAPVALVTSKYVCAHALWAVYKAGEALPEALNASILEVTLACMTRHDDEDNDDDDDDDDDTLSTSASDVSVALSMDDSLSASPSKDSGANDDDDDDDDEEDDEESCSWKPVQWPRRTRCSS